MKPLTKKSTKRSPEASHFSQMPLSRKQHQTAHFGFLSKQIGRANNEPNTVCKKSQGETGLRFSWNWKKDLSLQAQMIQEKFKNSLQEKQECVRAKMQQLQKEKYPNPSISVLHSMLPVPVPPLAQPGDL